MKKRLSALVVALSAMVIGFIASTAALAAPKQLPHHCKHLRTAAEFKRKAGGFYSGTRSVTTADFRLLGAWEFCSTKATKPKDHKVWSEDIRAHRARVEANELPPNYYAWGKVAVCESGGWVVLGSSYPDSLGITAANYEDFGGSPQPDGNTTLSERIAQVHVANRLIEHYGIGVPDQNGCDGSW